MTDFLTSLLASFLDKFKVSNPKLFTFIQLGLLALEFTVMKGIELQAFLGSNLTNAILVVIPVLMGALGTRTVKHMPGNDVAKLRAQEDGFKAYHTNPKVRAQSIDPNYLD